MPAFFSVVKKKNDSQKLKYQDILLFLFLKKKKGLWLVKKRIKTERSKSNPLRLLLWLFITMRQQRKLCYFLYFLYFLQVSSYDFLFILMKK